MAAYYDTAGTIVNSAAVECGLAPTSDPFASADPNFVQLCTLLTNAGRELYTKFQWQQFVKSYSFSTGPTPPSDGIFPLPDDFAYIIDQTGWTPNNIGMGLPLGGPYTEQQWTAIVAQSLAASTIYIGFKQADSNFYVLPAPPPVDTTIQYEYISRNWVQVHGDPDVGATVVANSDDLVMFPPILVVKLLATRWKQAKGFDATTSLEQFAAEFNTATSQNKAAPVLNMAMYRLFPLLNTYTNLPPTGYGL